MNFTNFGYLPLIRTIIILLVLSMVGACGSIPSFHQQKLADKSDSYEIMGFLVENDGVTPIAGATISVSTHRNDMVSIAPSKLQCSEPAADFETYTCTIEDGSFRLNLGELSTFPVKLHIEYKNQSQQIELTRDDITPELGILSFNPSSQKDSVAIVMDFYNPFDEIRELLESNATDIQAAKHQLISEYQNIYNISNEDNEVTFPTFYSLFIDDDMDGKADIHNYDTLYINSRNQSDIALLDQSLKNELAEFIANGGNLYITEWRIELEEVEPGPDQFI